MGAGSDLDVSSTVECLPVVHGGMARNSSNVKTLGLQHFQPVCIESANASLVVGAMKGRPDTFLPFIGKRVVQDDRRSPPPGL